MKQILMVLLVASTLSGCGFEIVDTGHRGVKTRFGEIIGEALPEGFYVYNPVTTTVIEIDVREQRLDDTTMTYTKDVQNVSVSFTLNLYLRPDAATNIYKEVGRDWQNKLVPQITLGKIKEVVGQYAAVDLISKRQDATLEIKTAITDALALKSIIVKNFEITNLDFNDPFERAVEAKVIAVQNAEQAKNRTVQIREEAEQKIIAAKAEAESMRIRAKALTQNKSLVEYEAVQKWDGNLPQIVTGGGAMPFINITPEKRK